MCGERVVCFLCLLVSYAWPLALALFFLCLCGVVCCGVSVGICLLMLTFHAQES